MSENTNRASAKKPLPIYKSYPNEINSIYGLLAANNELRIAEEVMGKRMAVIPYAKRDLHMIQSQIRKLTTNFLLTMPMEKREMVQKLMSKINYKVWVGPQASGQGTNDCYVDARYMLVIVKAAQDRCSTCFGSDPKKCRSCDLGHALDMSLKIDRGDRCWGDMDFSDWGEDNA